MATLSPGDKAPDFTLPDADGHPVSLSDFRGRKVIVYFYPAAMTPGCTTQACDFRDDMGSLAGSGYVVLGVSPDPQHKLAKFRDKHGLNFPLLGDEDHTVHHEWGTWGEKNVFGKRSVGVIRSTFVVDEDGRIDKAMYSVRATGHVAKLRQELGV